jgi:hypothetical protein
MKTKTNLILRTYFLLSFVLLILASISSCKGTDKNDDNINSDSSSEVNIQKEILYSMPAPSDIALVLIDSPNIKFHDDILNPVENSDKYITNKSIALNLGIYTADLSYASFFEQDQISLNYLRVSKKLAEDLGISNSVEERHLQMLSKTKLNKKAMMTLINETFMNTDAYLLENGRKDVMSMILVGGWVEAQYIATTLTNGSPTTNSELTQKIIEQQSAVQLMNLMFENVNETGDLKEIKEDVSKIREAYIKFNKGVTDENFKQFCDLIKKLRTKYVS